MCYVCSGCGMCGQARSSEVPICPACGAKLDNREGQCPECGFSFPAPPGQIGDSYGGSFEKTK